MPSCIAGCRFELLALATSRQHVNVQQFTEESPQEARLTQPAIAVPVKTVHVQVGVTGASGCVGAAACAGAQRLSCTSGSS
jgi:hypothetical protein